MTAQPALVTGAAGFAGRHLVELLATDGPVVGWYRPSEPAPPPMSRVRWVSVELLDPDSVQAALADVSPSAVYHLAGVPHVGDSWSKADETITGNVVGTLRLFDGLRARHLRCPVLVVGSATVYRPSSDALREDSPLGPTAPYGTSKLAQELAAHRLGRDAGIPVVVARSFNHIGPRQSPAFVASAFARQLTRIEAGLMPPVLKVGNLDARRDLSDVRDVVRAYRALVSKGRPGTSYNVCSGNAVTMRGLLDVLRALVKVPVTVEPDPARMRQADTPLVLGDRSLLTADTGWTPSIPFETTLADLVTYWREDAAREHS